MMIFFWIFIGVLVVIWCGVVLIGPPYVPTLGRDLQNVFDALQIGPDDHVVDLGAGDGRVLIAAARRGAKVSGVEINPFLVAIARWRLRRYHETVQFGNIWHYRLPRKTTYVCMFPAEAYMKRLELYLEHQRKAMGPFVVVLYGFRFSGREPEKTIGAFNYYQF